MFCSILGQQLKMANGKFEAPQFMSFRTTTIKGDADSKNYISMIRHYCGLCGLSTPLAIRSR